MKNYIIIAAFALMAAATTASAQSPCDTLKSKLFELHDKSFISSPDVVSLSVAVKSAVGFLGDNPSDSEICGCFDPYLIQQTVIKIQFSDYMLTDAPLAHKEYVRNLSKFATGILFDCD